MLNVLHALSRSQQQVVWGKGRQELADAWVTVVHTPDCRAPMHRGSAYIQLRVAVQNLDTRAMVVDLQDVQVRFKNGDPGRILGVSKAGDGVTEQVLSSPLAPSLVAVNGVDVLPAASRRAVELSMFDIAVISINVECPDCEFETDFLESYVVYQSPLGLEKASRCTREILTIGLVLAQVWGDLDPDSPNGQVRLARAVPVRPHSRQLPSRKYPCPDRRRVGDMEVLHPHFGEVHGEERRELNKNLVSVSNRLLCSFKGVRQPECPRLVAVRLPNAQGQLANQGEAQEEHLVIRPPVVRAPRLVSGYLPISASFVSDELSHLMQVTLLRLFILPCS